jgi:hypothetical protein
MRDVVGTWRLVRASATNEVGGPAASPPYGGENAQGRVTLGADGRMMAVLCDGTMTMGDGQTREYLSYCGNFTYDGRQLITKVDAASDPTRLNTEQVRDVSFEEDLMVLRPPLWAYRGAPEQRVLVWEQIAKG